MEGRIDSEQVGPGIAIVRFSGIVDTVSLAVTDPDPPPTSASPASTSASRRWVTSRPTRNVGEAFVREVDKQYLEDKPIWEHKAHLVRPALAAEDGPFMKFRQVGRAVLRRGHQRRPHGLPASVGPGQGRRGPREGHGQRQARRPERQAHAGGRWRRGRCGDRAIVGEVQHVEADEAVALAPPLLGDGGPGRHLLAVADEAPVLDRRGDVDPRGRAAVGRAWLFVPACARFPTRAGDASGR